MINLLKSIAEFLEKQKKVYLKPGKAAPEGERLISGKKGGRYYEIGEKLKPLSEYRVSQLDYRKKYLRNLIPKLRRRTGIPIRSIKRWEAELGNISREINRRKGIKMKEKEKGLIREEQYERPTALVRSIDLFLTKQQIRSLKGSSYRLTDVSSKKHPGKTVKRWVRITPEQKFHLEHPASEETRIIKPEESKTKYGRKVKSYRSPKGIMRVKVYESGGHKIIDTAKDIPNKVTDEWIDWQLKF